MDASYRLIAFVAVFMTMLIWEYWRPRRLLDQQRAQRWPVNLGLMLIGSLLVRLTVGGIVYQTAVIVEEKNLGLLAWFNLSHTSVMLISLIALDFIIYWQHVASHKIPLLWKMHQVHHADQVYDTSTGVRFHPLEIFFSLFVKMSAILLLGVSPIAILIFEILLNCCSVFNHSNVYLPTGLDRLLRKLIVTPDMHRVHHSIYRDETDSNYGFSTSIWDRLCGSYRDQPRDGHSAMRIGLPYVGGKASHSLSAMLLLPFKRLN